MPNIREYNSTEALQGIRPNELGADAMAQSGRRIGAVYSEAGEALARGVARIGQAIGQTQKEGHGGGGGRRRGNAIDTADSAGEIATGAAALSKTQEGLTQDWNQTANTADLNDTTIADKFTSEKLEPALDQWQQGFTTEKGAKWAATQAQKVREHFFTKMTGDMGTRAGDALHVNMDNTLNSFSNLARNDPSSMEHVMDQWRDTTQSLIETNPNLDVKTASKARAEIEEKGVKQIAQSAAIGMAEKNPDQLLKDIDAGRFNDVLDGTAIKQVQGYAKQQQGVQRQQATQNSQNAADEYERALFDPQTGGMKNVTVDMIGQALNDPRMLGPQRKATVDWLQQQMKGQAAGARMSDPNVMAGLQRRFAGDPTQYPTQQEIGAQIAQGTLTLKDGNELNSIRKMVSPTETKDPAAAALFKGALKTGHANIFGSTSPGDISAADQTRVQRFDSWFYDAFAQQTKAGRSPQQLLTPGSPDYLLKPENMQYFATNGDDLVNSAHQDYGASAVAAPLSPPTGGAQQPKPPQPAQQRKPLAAFFGGMGQ